jgi:hypothetical protein
MQIDFMLFDVLQKIQGRKYRKKIQEENTGRKYRDTSHIPENTGTHPIFL